MYTFRVMLWKAKCFSAVIPHAHQNVICITASTSTDTGPAPTSLTHTHPPRPVCLLFGSPLHLSFLSLFLPHHFQHSVPPPLLTFFLFLVSLSPPHFHCTKPFFFSIFPPLLFSPCLHHFFMHCFFFLSSTSFSFPKQNDNCNWTCRSAKCSTEFRQNNTDVKDSMICV